MAVGSIQSHFKIVFQTMAMLGVSSFVFLVCHTSDYHTALFLMTMALTCNAFHTSAVCVIPQDIAPKYSGSVYGKFLEASDLVAVLKCKMIYFRKYSHTVRYPLLQ